MIWRGGFALRKSDKERLSPSMGYKSLPALPGQAMFAEPALHVIIRIIIRDQDKTFHTKSKF